MRAKVGDLKPRLGPLPPSLARLKIPSEVRVPLIVVLPAGEKAPDGLHHGRLLMLSHLQLRYGFLDVPPSPPPYRSRHLPNHLRRGVYGQVQWLPLVSDDIESIDHRPPESGTRGDECRRWSVHSAPWPGCPDEDRQLDRHRPHHGAPRLPRFPHRHGPLPDGELVCIKSWVGLPFGSTVRQHELNIEVLSSRASCRRGCGTGGPSLIAKHGVRDTHDTLTVRHGLCTACPQQLINFDADLLQPPELLDSLLEVLEAFLLDVRVPTSTSGQARPK